MSHGYFLEASSKHTTHALVLGKVLKNQMVLDVGCNDGYLGSASDSSNTFYGLDQEEDAVIKAKKHYKDVIVYNLNELEKLPWGLKFDVIIFADVLEHVVDPEKTLLFFVENYLKEDGSVSISLPNIAYWYTRLGLLFGNFDYTETGILDKTHLHFYTAKSAKHFLSNVGLKSVEMKYGSIRFGWLCENVPLFGIVFGRLLAYNLVFYAKKQ
jgi:2-polyprenyl-3-methyl-5-hydroxy-6-metoxy-1,4-benzoquinol methylase